MAQDHSDITGTGRPIVFYDGGCPLCRREIEHYQRIDRDRRLCWIDISQGPQAVRRHGLSVEQAMQRLHVLDADGHWQTGICGFIELWSRLPYYRQLAKLLRLSGLERPLEIIYRYWARWRVHQRCNDTQCGPQSRLSETDSKALLKDFRKMPGEASRRN